MAFYILINTNGTSFVKVNYKIYLMNSENFIPKIRLWIYFFWKLFSSNSYFENFVLKISEKFLEFIFWKSPSQDKMITLKFE